MRTHAKTSFLNLPEEEIRWSSRSKSPFVTLEEGGWHSVAARHVAYKLADAPAVLGSPATAAPRSYFSEAATTAGTSGSDTSTASAPRAYSTGSYYTGTDSANSLSGSSLNDTLTGKKGNDTLYGGAGSDVYVFSKGDGQDRIVEYAFNTGSDSIRFTDVASTETLRFVQNSNGTLSIHYGQSDEIILENFVENMSVAFSNGVTRKLADLIQQHGVSTAQTANIFRSSGSKDDIYIIDHLDDVIDDWGGNDTAIVSVSGYKVPQGIENVIYTDGAQALPYFIDALTSSYLWGAIGQAISLTYSFVSSNTDNLSGFAQYTAAQKQHVRTALSSWAEVSGLKFVEKADAANIDLRFFRHNLADAGDDSVIGYAYFPPHGDVHIKTSYTMGPDGSNPYDSLLVHEIGHALGLKHPGFYDIGDVGPYLPYSEDTLYYTQMSYHGYLGEYIYPDKGPQIFDVAAIQYLYGVNTSQRTGNDTYRFSDIYIWDGAGTDTLDGRDQTAALNINLAPGSWIYAGSKKAKITDAGQAFIGYGTELENAHGGKGNDQITGNHKNNVLFGHNGNDTLKGLAGDDRLYGGLGDDKLYGGSGDDQLYGYDGDDLLSGHDGDDTLYGGAGNDKMVGGAGADYMAGGAGNDSYWVDNAGDKVVETVNNGTDLVNASISYVLGSHVENLTLIGSKHINGTGNALDNILTGNSGNNILNGGAGNDILNGGAGNDKLYGGDGNDKLIGGLGADYMAGGAGNDNYWVDNTGDKVIETEGGGTDRVYAGISYTLGNHVENLTLTGTAHINGVGNALNNTLIGNSGNNILNGGAGNDIINGGAGNDKIIGGLGKDTLTGGAGADLFTFSTALGGGNVDTITDFGNGNDKIGLSSVIFGNINTANSDFFRQGTTAADADNRIVYHKASGKLYYDADGVGGAAAVQFAQLTANTELNYTHFTVL